MNFTNNLWDTLSIADEFLSFGANLIVPEGILLLPVATFLQEQGGQQRSVAGL